jgi:hypothetical protein
LNGRTNSSLDSEITCNNATLVYFHFCRANSRIYWCDCLSRTFW